MKDVSTTTLVVVLLFAVGAVCAFEYYRIFVTKNYRITYQVPCDQAAERCFVAPCDEESAIHCTATPYARITKYAYDIARSCGNTVEGCTAAMTCSPQDDRCTHTYCTNTDTETCTDPYQFNNM